MTEDTFRGCTVLERWEYLGRTCLLIQGPDEPPLAIYDESNPDAVLELVPPAALLKLVQEIRSQRNRGGDRGCL